MSSYLDHNATTPVKPEVISAVAEAFGDVGNASSVHEHGRRAKRRLELARDQIAHLVKALPSEVVFTSGGAESNNLALLGGSSAGQVDHLIISAIEHDSVLKSAQRAPLPVTVCPVTADGVVDLSELRSLFTQCAESGQRVLLSVMMANNETGVLQPLSDIAALVQEFDALLHCDAVQGVGKVPIRFEGSGIDFLSLSAHKMGGPQGVGALIVKSGRGLAPCISGGGQENNRRAGTENLPGIVGFGFAAALIGREDNLDTASLRDEMEQSVLAVAPDAVIFGRNAARISNTSCMAVDGLSAETQVMAMDLAGVSISAGSACSSGKVASSHVLKAMGVNDTLADSAIRVSLGWDTRREDIDRFVKAWSEHYQKAAHRLKQMKAAS